MKKSTVKRLNKHFDSLSNKQLIIDFSEIAQLLEDKHLDQKTREVAVLALDMIHFELLIRMGK